MPAFQLLIIQIGRCNEIAAPHQWHWLCWRLRQAAVLPQGADSWHWEFLTPIFFSWAQQDFRPGRRGEHTAEQSRKHLTVMRPWDDRGILLCNATGGTGNNASNVQHWCLQVSPRRTDRCKTHNYLIQSWNWCEPSWLDCKSSWTHFFGDIWLLQGP